MTDYTDFFDMILALAISFIANYSLSFLLSTLQTLPKPPLPIAYNIVKLDLLILGTLSLSLDDLKLQFPIIYLQ